MMQPARPIRRNFAGLCLAIENDIAAFAAMASRFLAFVIAIAKFIRANRFCRKANTQSGQPVHIDTIPSGKNNYHLFITDIDSFSNNPALQIISYLLEDYDKLLIHPQVYIASDAFIYPTTDYGQTR